MSDVIIYFIISVFTVILTIITEYPVIRISFGKQKNIVANVVLINSITNIALNMIIIPILSEKYIFILEALIVFVEMYMYKWCYKELSYKRILLTSLLANVVSFIVGLFILFWYLL